MARPGKLDQKWTAASCEPFAVRKTMLTGELVHPFAEIVNEDGDKQIAAAYVEYVFIDPASETITPVPYLNIVLPGPCGHYKCGGMVEVCLN